jgi:AcrR family transcriptional regulator
MSDTETAPRRRGRPAIPKDVQRQRLIEAAILVFENKQYEKTRVADIVGEAGMSSRSFYEHFQSKDDLFASVANLIGKAFVGSLRSIFAETADPMVRIDRGLHAFFDLFNQMPIDLESLGGNAGQAVRDARRESVREITDLVLRELELMREQGRVAEAPDRASVELILTGVEGMAFRYFSEGRGGELRELHPTVMALLARTLLG